uniref:hypothetical protein n=1 Tax=Tolypothrix sp. FACHB-123 TaxID=2692868 RepID=UPI001686366D|nr:hypothetical protein [Tolypothrix sp. FACHB-123]MBD2356618.1 hypothetical protein [Tolypothrix sp. FACHB-123]
MNNPGDRENYRSETQKEYYTDSNGETQTHLQKTTETVNNATNVNSYGSGYVNGRDSERRYQQANLAERDSSNTANGLLLGVILTSLVTLAVGAFWYFNQRNNAANENVSPVFVPVPSSASPSAAASQSPQPRTTIIERTREVPVIIPQQQAPVRSAPTQPNINITVPPQQPTTEKAPTTSPNTPSQPNSTSNSPTSTNQSDTLTTTPSSGANQPNTNSSNSSSSSENSKTGSSD